MRTFCTYFDHRYLTRGLALYESLQRHCPEFQLFILCMDAEARRLLTGLSLEHAILITIEELESHDPVLAGARANRSLVEYYFTCSAPLPLCVFRLAPDADIVTYLDADLLFFSSPEVIFEEMGNRSVAIVPHSYPDSRRHLEVYGIYNVGWLSFRRDATGMACLERWRRQCIDWCHDRLEEGRFADQKYLDDWPGVFDQVAVISNPGAGVAPWNVARYLISMNEGVLHVDGHPLVFFHYQGFKLITSWLAKIGLRSYGARATTDIIEGIYRPYTRTLKRLSSAVFSRDVSASTQSIRARLTIRPGALIQIPWLILTRELVLDLDLWGSSRS